MRAFTVSGKIICWGLVLLLTAALLTAFIGSFVSEDLKAMPAYIVLLSCIAFIAAFMLLKWLTGRFKAFFERYYLMISLGIVLAVLALNIVFGCILRLTPLYDFGSVYDASVNVAETGLLNPWNGSLRDPDYFYYFPHNLGTVSLLAAVFSLVKLLGSSDYFIAGMVLNAILFAGSVGCIAGSLKRTVGKANAVFGLLLVLLCPLTYFIAPIFYTDGLSMLFPVLTIYLYIRFIQAKDAKGKLIFSCLIALAAAIGAMIKISVLIVLAALVVHQIVSGIALDRPVKGKLMHMAQIVPSILIAALLLFGMNTLNTAFYASQTDKGRAADLEMPKLHWVMMGLSGSGRYSSADYDYTRSFPAGDERDEAIARMIETRLKTNGFSGMVKLFARKTTILLGDGTLNIPDFIQLADDKTSSLYELTAGEHKPIFSSVSRGYMLAMLFVIIMGGISGLIKLSGKRLTNKTNFLSDDKINPESAEFALRMIPKIALLGVIIFFCCWEVSERYIMGFMPMLMLMAAYALCGEAEILEKERIG